MTISSPLTVVSTFAFSMLLICSAEAQDRRTYLQNCARQAGIVLDSNGNYQNQSRSAAARYEACKANAPSGGGARRTTPRPYSGVPSKSQRERDAARGQ